MNESSFLQIQKSSYLKIVFSTSYSLFHVAACLAVGVSGGSAQLKMSGVKTNGFSRCYLAAEALNGSLKAQHLRTTIRWQGLSEVQ